MTGGKGQDLTFSLPISFGNTPAPYPCFLPLASICLLQWNRKLPLGLGLSLIIRGEGKLKKLVISHHIYKETEKCSN